MIVLHANWSDAALHVWGEQAFGRPQEPAEPGGAEAPAHPFGADASALRAALGSILPLFQTTPAGAIALRLPTAGGRPVASPRIAHALGHAAADEESPDVALARWRVETLALPAGAAARALDALEDAALEGRAALGPSVAFFGAAARLARALLAEERFVPGVAEIPGNPRAHWAPWTSDEHTGVRMGALLAATPPSARSAEDVFHHDPRAIAEDFVWSVADAHVRAVFAREQMIEAIEGRDLGEPAALWLSGLLGAEPALGAPAEARSALARSARQWISRLEERGADAAWRLRLTLLEPEASSLIPERQAPGEDVRWTLRLGLEAVDRAGAFIDAADIWQLKQESVVVEGVRLDSPQDLLLAELARAARLYPALDTALEESAPKALSLSSRGAYEFLREFRPLLLEQGFGCDAPEWWEAPASRLGARLQIESPGLDEEDSGDGSGASPAARAAVGLESLVDYRWEIAIGDTTLSLKEFESLAAQRAPLVRVDGQWIEIRPEDVAAAVRFIKENPGGQMRVSEALRLAHAWDAEQVGIPILGLDAKGWVAGLLGASDEGVPTLQQPENFRGALRPYQLRGLSWLAFLSKFGMGACLADEMGLGKTVQLLAFLLHERTPTAEDPAPRPGPTLIVAPMSVVANWQRETERFAPSLRALVHHGADRLQGGPLVEAAENSDVVITTYAIVHRDRELLQRVKWRRVALDEAQNVKNASAKQSDAVRSLPADRRVALTGTPVENRLSELWSIMDFCNPGLLGGPADFRRRFSVPIERHHSRARAKQLRNLVQPFILRRLKTDPNITADLPAKVESREFCRLTPEQATLYETTVKRMLSDVEQTEGIQRRGVVLASLVRLKQICNHPSQFLRDVDVSGGPPPAASRSGKCVRLLEMLEEVVAARDQALVFTQFRQMAMLLTSMISHDLDREALTLHGGTPAKQRQQLIDRFQKADGTAPILILSLKAGGVGLNLTAANHVFHFDRWWNPAVESQATDRAHRIGQTRTVQVHKFIVAGTLEERIDALIEQKTELAESIITSGENWLTELSTSQLRDLVALGPDAVVDDVDREEALEEAGAR